VLALLVCVCPYQELVEAARKAKEEGNQHYKNGGK